MRYAVISDIHGNVLALDSVLADARQKRADGYIFAGDYLISAPWPNEVYRRILSCPNHLAVRGNEESYIHIPDGNDGQFEISRFCRRILENDAACWADTLPSRIDVHLSGLDVHISHSSSDFFGKAEHKRFSTRRLAERYPDRSPSRSELLEAVKNELSTDESFLSGIDPLSKGIYIFGHSHFQWHAEFGGKIFINPGSCGLPLDCEEKMHAPYTLLTIENGVCQIEERRIPYDEEKLIECVKSTDQYTQARVWSEIIFEEWRTRREKVFHFLSLAERYSHSIGDDIRPFQKDTWEKAYLKWRSLSEKEKLSFGS
ncbi:MAG: metallophosphoesterase family protein [Clostridia bacterium]|nr:metallophosphoesterase family protein [Clostridia bacterium]